VTTYADKTTEELVNHLEAGALVLAREKMKDFPRMLQAAARRLESLQRERNRFERLWEQAIAVGYQSVGREEPGHE